MLILICLFIRSVTQYSVNNGSFLKGKVRIYLRAYFLCEVKIHQMITRVPHKWSLELFFNFVVKPPKSWLWAQ